MYPYGGGYGAPGYGAPGYGAPGYGAPGYGAPGYGGGYPPAYPGYGAPGYGAPVGVPVVGTGVVAPVPVVVGPNYLIQFHVHNIDRPIKDIILKATGQPSPFLAVYATTNPFQPLTYYQQRMERLETDEKQYFGNVDPDWVLVYKSETIHNNKSPTWNPFTLSLQQLCSGNWDAGIKFDVWDHHDMINHDFLGSAVTTLRELQAQREVRLTNRRRVGVFNTSGLLQLTQFAQV